MDHQDWAEVQLKKTHTKQAKQGVSQRAENTDVKLVPSKDLKKAMMQARVDKKLTQQDLARNMNIPLSTIKNWESGKIVPNNKQIANLERKLGTKLPRCKKLKKPTEDSG